MHFRNRTIEFEMERNLTKWEGNNKMFKKLQKSVKSKFKLKTQFAIYDPKDDMFVDDIDDLCGCYIGYELDYDFILSLHIKADNEPMDHISETITTINEDREDSKEEILDNLSPLTLKSMNEIEPQLEMERRRSRQLSVDLSVFDKDTTCQLNTVWLEFGAARIANCSMLNRLISALRYYQSLDIEHSEVDRDEFNNFFDDTYTNMLDDFLHLISEHSVDLEEIHTSLFNKYGFKPCDIKTCKHTLRHFCDKSTFYAKSDCDDPWIDFYIETYDSLHFWLFHLFEVGLRSKKIQIANDKSAKIKKNNMLCFDDEFAKMSERINKRRKETKNVCLRYDKVQKYELNVTKSDNIECMMKSVDSERLTFFDRLMIFVQKTKQKKVLNALYTFINEEEYDSDALIEDIYADHGQFSNLCAVIKHNKRTLNAIKEYIQRTNVTSSSFSIGLTFYYWPYYQKHSEYKANYVNIKHATFKQEILEYAAIDIWKYNHLIVPKAKQYQQTQIIKSIHVKFNPHLHFDVRSGVLTRENLIALILYTDFIDISSEFASCFRQIRFNESLESIKKRAQSYWWLAKILRETVQYFGSNGSATGQNVKGPFYTSMNKVIEIPEFNISLCSPVSTSKQIEVIARCKGGKNGMMLQLNNNGDYESSRYLRSFNVSWISKYKEEDERLFIGGDWKIRIETIKIFETKQNFGAYFNAFFIFDCIVSGWDIDRSADVDKNAISAANYDVSSIVPKEVKVKGIAQKLSKRLLSPKENEETICFDDAEPLQLDAIKPKTEKKKRRGSTMNIMPLQFDDDDDDKKENGKKKQRRASTMSMSPINFSKSSLTINAQSLKDTKITFLKELNLEKKVKSKDKIEEKPKKKSADYEIVKNLIDGKLGRQRINQKHIPRYVMNSFYTFCKEKKVVRLNLFHLDKNFKEFADLIMHKIEVDTYKTMGTPWMPNPYSRKNTFLSKLFLIFENVQRLEIYSTKFDGFPSYSFSLMSFLSSVEFEKTAFKQIVIKATWDESNNENGKRSWLHTMWNQSPLGAVKSLLKENRCTIELKKEKNNIELWEDVLVIDRE